MFYMKGDSVFGVPVNRDELRGLILRRNDIATYIQTGNSRLPPTLRDKANVCKWCHQLDTCTLYHKVLLIY